MVTGADDAAREHNEKPKHLHAEQRASARYMIRYTSEDASDLMFVVLLHTREIKLQARTATVRMPANTIA